MENQSNNKDVQDYEPITREDLIKSLKILKYEEILVEIDPPPDKRGSLYVSDETRSREMRSAPSGKIIKMYEPSGKEEEKIIEEAYPNFFNFKIGDRVVFYDYQAQSPPFMKFKNLRHVSIEDLKFILDSDKSLY